MGKASEIWKEIKPKIGEMLMAVNNIETQAEKAQEEAYQKGVQDTKQHWVDAPRTCAYKLGYENGLNDAWEAARKIASDNAGRNYSIFGQHFTVEILNTHSASEAIEEIRAYEQAQKEIEERAQKEEEKSISAEDVMRQYLNEFCKGHRCTDKECALHTHDFTCGRGYHFLTSCVSDEEVRRAYAKVLQKDEGKS